MFDLIKEEIKNAISKRILIFTLIIFLINSIALYIIPTENFLFTLIISIVSNISIILIFIGSEILSKDYMHNTYKYVYTGSFPRKKIILLKLGSMIIIAILFALIGSILLVASTYIKHETISLEEVIKTILNLNAVFIVYTLIVFSTSFLILALTKNFSATIITTYIIFFDIFTPFITTGINKIQNNVLKSTLKNIPYLYASNGAKKLYYSCKEICIILTFSITILGIALYIFEKRDL